jgi:hypothetical protein
MFPAADMTQARYVRIGAPDGAVASTAMIKGFQVPTEVAVVNGINAATGPEITFPHVVTGAFTGAAYTTTIGVTNLADVSQTLTISFNPGEGTPMVARRVLAAHAAVRETAQSLFGLSDEFRTGWVRVTGSAPITGFASYADTVRGGLAIVPPTAPDTSFFFLHIADGPPQWQTGLALLNTSSTSATVEIDAMSQSGSLIGTTTMTMEPGKKIANVIHELISETRGVNGGFICVRSTNDVPLYGMELFYTQDLRVLSNVAAGRLAKGTSCGPRQ